MNLDDLKAQDSDYEETEETTEDDLSNALSILEDCAKFIETIWIGMKLSGSLKAEIETLLEDIYSFTSQYEVEEEEKP